MTTNLLFSQTYESNTNLYLKKLEDLEDTIEKQKHDIRCYTPAITIIGITPGKNNVTEEEEEECDVDLEEEEVEGDNDSLMEESNEIIDDMNELLDESSGFQDVAIDTRV
jgi:hypothetical protein